MTHPAIMPRMRSRGISLLLLAVICPVVLLAQAASEMTGPDTSLITLGPGQEVYERFSHNAIWIHDPSQRYANVAFNYGLFTFGGDFIPRFIFGTMRYWMAPEDTSAMLDAYKLNGRSIWIQKLDLSSEQTRDLSHALWNNAEPENRYYTYNYYTDNCSTRVRDALDRATGGAIKAQTESQFTDRTYRFHTLRVLADNPLLYIGVDYLLGQRGDDDLSEWEEMFLPQYMMQHLRHVNFEDAPLIASEQTYARSSRPPVRPTPPNWNHWYLLAGLTLALSLLLSERCSSRRAGRVVRFLVLLCWLALSSAAGVILTFMTLFTGHWAVRPNENMLQMAPLALIPLVLLPWALRRRDGMPRHPKVLRTTAITCIILLGMSALGMLLKLLPAFYQDNWRIISLALPINAAVAIIFSRAAATTPRAAHP